MKTVSYGSSHYETLPNVCFFRPFPATIFTLRQFYESVLVVLFVLSDRSLFIYVQNYSFAYFNFNAFRQDRGRKKNPQRLQRARNEFNKLFPIKKICIEGNDYKHYNSHIARKVRNVTNLSPVIHIFDLNCTVFGCCNTWLLFI